MGNLSVKHASIGPISVVFPDRCETNDDLKREFPNWDLALIEEKTGIAQRFIAAEGQTASDLGVEAAQKLFAEYEIDPSTIDFLLFCTQTPDYPLPTTACLIQDRLGLPTHCGALDFNLGCSGFVYGLSLAEGLIASGAARRILFITAETYSKYIDPQDRSLRTIFGDAAAATLIESSDSQELSGFCFGTDGKGADTLLVTDGGARAECDAIKPRHRKRWASRLYMDGASLMSFTVEAIPKLLEDIYARASVKADDVDLFLFHQATRKMLELLQQRLAVSNDRLPILLADYGNTVSCTLPILIEEMRVSGRLKASCPNVLIGFGVGWSWAGCVWTPGPNACSTRTTRLLPS